MTHEEGVMGRGRLPVSLEDLAFLLQFPSHFHLRDVLRRQDNFVLEVESPEIPPGVDGRPVPIFVAGYTDSTTHVQIHTYSVHRQPAEALRRGELIPADGAGSLLEYIESLFRLLGEGEQRDLLRTLLLGDHPMTAPTIFTLPRCEG